MVLINWLARLHLVYQISFPISFIWGLYLEWLDLEATSDKDNSRCNILAYCSPLNEASKIEGIGFVFDKVLLLHNGFLAIMCKEMTNNQQSNFCLCKHITENKHSPISRGVFSLTWTAGNNR